MHSGRTSCGVRRPQRQRGQRRRPRLDSRPRQSGRAPTTRCSRSASSSSQTRLHPVPWRQPSRSSSSVLPAGASVRVSAAGSPRLHGSLRVRGDPATSTGSGETRSDGTGGRIREAARASTSPRWPLVRVAASERGLEPTSRLHGRRARAQRSPPWPRPGHGSGPPSSVEGSGRRDSQCPTRTVSSARTTFAWANWLVLANVDAGCLERRKPVSDRPPLPGTARGSQARSRGPPRRAGPRR